MTQITTEQDFAQLVGPKGFLGSIFDEILVEIEEEANKAIGLVPNTSGVTISFPSEGETKSGTVRTAITPAITVQGAPTSTSSLSGGMETVVELAVDLAVNEVVSRRAGTLPAWLILDESFTGLGATEKEAIMEILARYAADKLVLVVDHGSEFQELFTQTIVVSHSEGRSTCR